MRQCHHSATSIFTSAMVKHCLVQFLPPCTCCHHFGVPAECHHPPEWDWELVQLVTSGPEAGDRYQGIPEPLHSGDSNCPWGQAGDGTPVSVPREVTCPGGSIP